MAHAISVLLSYLRLRCASPVSWGCRGCLVAFTHGWDPAEEDRRDVIHGFEAGGAIRDVFHAKALCVLLPRVIIFHSTKNILTWFLLTLWISHLRLMFANALKKQLSTPNQQEKP